jgi:hypothetical protein
MFRQAMFAMIGALTVLATGAAAQQRGHDYPPFAEIDGMVRGDFSDHRFDFYDFASGNGVKPVRVEGHKTEIRYDPKDGSTVSVLEIDRTILE